MELQLIQDKIYVIRGMRVMLDYDLAELYPVETKKLKQAVRRNIKRFPSDFMFEITENEYRNIQNISLRSQNATSNWGGLRYMPFAFTQEGVAMLSGVLTSDIAIEVNISIMRTFVLLRKQLFDYSELYRRVEQLEQDHIVTNSQLAEIYAAITELAGHPEHSGTPRNPIGFKTDK